MKRMLLVALGMLLLAAPSWARPTPPEDICTQGQFAVMLAEELWPNTERYFNIPIAIDRLNLTMITPIDGWKPEAPLTRRVMAEVLDVLHAQYSPQAPLDQMTKAEVAGMLAEQDDVLNRYRNWQGIGAHHRIFRPYYPLPAYTK